MAYKNVKLGDVYRELKEVKKHLEHLEYVMIPEKKVSARELKRINKYRLQSLRDYEQGKTVKLED